MSSMSAMKTPSCGSKGCNDWRRLLELKLWECGWKQSLSSTEEGEKKGGRERDQTNFYHR